MKRSFFFLATISVLSFFTSTLFVRAEVATSYSFIPPFLTASMPPMVMLTMARDHRLYYEAYNDASDINEDGILDVRYNPNIDYYGYFDSYKYYEYNSTNHGRFEPRGTTTNKKTPSGSNQYWSGDFLNYVSMTRMDCLRKVLYGGLRSTDTATETVLERAYIPQDAHSFGKEYDSISYDGFDIREYTPLSLPISGTRHHIATTALGNYDPTASTPTGLPLLRVRTNTTDRIWNWVATERPVVKTIVGGTIGHPGHPADKAAFDTLVSNYADASRLFGTNNPTVIDGSENPHGADDNYLTIVTGKLVVTTAGTYRLAINGDDAIDFRINGVSWSDAKGVTVTGDTIGWYGGHGAGTIGDYRADTYLTTGEYDIEFRHEEMTGSDSYRLYWRNPSNNWVIVPAESGSTPIGLKNLTLSTYNLVTNSAITDYTLRVKVGDSSMPESNCKQYPNGTYKPIGVLQRHGESEQMLFGLMTGSYTNNLSGGVLRQQVGSIKQEISNNSGEFLYQDNSTIGGIIRTLDKLIIHGFRNDANFDYNENCGWITTQALSEGKCRMWGNPMAEMMYETARYYAGASSATTQFTYDPNTSTLDDNQIGLPLATWNNPYNATNYCAKPIMLAISDIYPSYDSDQLPGSAWSSTISSTLSGLNVETGITAIANAEGVNGTFYIGQNGSPGTTGYDGACTPKGIPGLESIRGLCPEEPSKQGSYYAAAVTHHAATTDLSNATSTQSMLSYMVALSSPLPEIRIPVAGQIVTMVPFAKSVGGSSINADKGNFQPTNTIVDFFVEEITPTTGTFRVNFEDVEQGADHDMDAIVRYHYEVQNNSTVTVTLSSEYAAGGIIQHMGYIISGTTDDGTYLVVRDKDTAEGSDPDYYLDTPPSVLPQTVYNANGPWKDAIALPLSSTRIFSPGATAGASLLKNPLWYAAKWGGFTDSNGNNMPDLIDEWDHDHNGVPDTYFFVANPTRLEEQLNKAFGDILRRTASGTAASVISQSREGEGAVYQSIFFPEFKDILGNTINWAGQAHALFVDARGNIREDTNHNSQLDPKTDKVITYAETTINRYRDWNGDNVLTAAEKSNSTELLTGPLDINFLWSSSSWLNTISDADVVAQRSQYNATTDNRFIFTFADKDNDMLVDSGEIQDFVWPPNSPVATPNVFLNGTTDYYAYLTLYPSFTDTPSSINTIRTAMDPTPFGPLLTELARRQIDFIRGADQSSTTISGYSIPASRSRIYAINTSTTLTWRLSDIVYSTPTVIGTPAESYNMLYLDDTYQIFRNKYKNRRQMIYVGGNDGMLHAFNGGFYNSTRKGFDLQHSGEVSFPLGMEVWGYIPYNLLPHLLWLSDLNYGSNLHVPYMDLKPRVFDARVFFAPNSMTPIDADHPNGWGTILVAGMRMGGGEIRADLDKTDSLSFDSTTDRTMSSAYVVMDITNPEKQPTVIAEIRMPRQGFTTCYPTAMPMTTANTSTDTANEWYLVFGSGPANAAGQADPTILGSATSAQNGQLYVLDLKALIRDKTVKTLNNSGFFTAGSSTFATTEPNSFIADPIAVDVDLGSKASTNGEFKADIIYYGTTAGSPSNGTGTMRRLITSNAMPVSNMVPWTGNTTLANVGQPVTAAPSAATDSDDNLWVFFGSGRFYNRTDIPQVNHMSFYGIKEPVSNSTFSWASVDSQNLFNSTQITLTNGTCPDTNYDKDCIGVKQSGTDLSGGWSTLVSLIDAAPGWRQDFSPSLERVLGQPAVLGGALLFNTYLPSIDLCAFEGTSSLWALFYKTGTAYFNPILRGGADIFATSVDLGRGMAITPNLHIGEKAGSTAFIQTSTGAIITVEITNPFSVKSGSLYWRKNTD